MRISRFLALRVLANQAAKRALIRVYRNWAARRRPAAPEMREAEPATAVFRRRPEVWSSETDARGRRVHDTSKMV